MIIKIDELTGRALDWAVAQCEKMEFTYPEYPGHEMFDIHYSTDWSQGGPIIERNEIAIQCVYCDGVLDGWMADSKKIIDEEGMETYGPTPLIAAMRCYVASTLGDEIKIPGVLIQP